MLVKKKRGKGGLKKNFWKKKKVVSVTNNLKEFGWRSFANFFFIA